MMRLMKITVVGLVVLAVVLYAGDWIFFKLIGSPTQTITVSLFVSVPLKGPNQSPNENQEIDYIGQEDWTCTRTLFPQIPFEQNRSLPCWYLRKHTNQVTTY